MWQGINGNRQKMILGFVGTDVVDSFAAFSDMADSYSNDAARIAADKLQQNVEHFIV